MNKRQLIKALRAAEDRISEQIALSAGSGERFAGPLSSEGYLGGYRQALSDVSLILADVPILDDRRIWTDLKAQ